MLLFFIGNSLTTRGPCGPVKHLVTEDKSWTKHFECSRLSRQISIKAVEELQRQEGININVLGSAVYLVILL